MLRTVGHPGLVIHTIIASLSEDSKLKKLRNILPENEIGTREKNY